MDSSFRKLQIKKTILIFYGRYQQFIIAKQNHPTFHNLLYPSHTTQLHCCIPLIPSLIPYRISSPLSMNSHSISYLAFYRTLQLLIIVMEQSIVIRKYDTWNLSKLSGPICRKGFTGPPSVTLNYYPSRHF